MFGEVIMLSELTKLADENSSEKRRELMTSIADLFITNNDNVSDNEMTLFGDILTILLNVMDHNGKIEISKDFSGLPNPPKSFAMALATEAAEIATPILTSSLVFTDEDLVKISQNGDIEHRLAISNREVISTEVTDSLISFGENVVLRSISVNKGAAISDEGMRIMLEHAVEDKELLVNMANREDLFEQLKLVMPTLPKKAQGQFGSMLARQNPGEFNALLSEANKKLAENSRAKRMDKIQAKAEANNIDKGTISKSQAVIGYARSDKPLKIATLFATFGNLDEKYVSNALLQMNGDALVVLCKSVGIDSYTVREIGEMRCRILKIPSSSIERLVSNFENMDEEASQRTMRFVKLKTNLQKVKK